MKIRLALAALAVAATTQAHAQAFNSDGVASGQSQGEVIEFGPDHNIISSKIVYNKFEMADETHPMNQMKGQCVGTIEVRGGAVDGNGACVLDGLEGDRLLLGWIARGMNKKGEMTGYWTVNNGTGLWLLATGGGTFRSNINRANGTAVNTLKGAVTLR